MVIEAGEQRSGVLICIREYQRLVREYQKLINGVLNLIDEYQRLIKRVLTHRLRNRE